MTQVLIYLTLSIAWGVGGFVGGFYLGARAKKKLDPDKEPAMTSPLNEEVELVVDRLPWYRRTQVWIGVTVALVGLGTIGQGFVFGAKTAAITNCQAAWIQGFSTALSANSAAAQAALAPQDEMWKTFREGLTGATPDIRAKFSQQLDEYLAARQKAKDTRSDNPIVAAPANLCK